MQNKVLTAAAAVQLIQDRAFVAIQGAGGGVAEPTALMKALGERYQQEQQPRDLTLCHATGLGDKVEIGCDYLAHPGLVKRDGQGRVAQGVRVEPDAIVEVSGHGASPAGSGETG